MAAAAMGGAGGFSATQKQNGNGKGRQTNK